MKYLRYSLLRIGLLCLLWGVFLSCGETLGPSEKVGEFPVEVAIEAPQRDALEAFQEPQQGEEASIEPPSSSEESKEKPSVMDEPPAVSDASESPIEAQEPEPASESIPELPVESPPEPSQPTTLTLAGGVSLSPAPQPGKSVTITYQGSLARRSNLTLHYGFNGWNALQGQTQTKQDDGTSNSDFYQQAPMTPLPVSQGSGYEVTITIPAQAKALHMVFFTKSSQAQEWDNNQGQDFNIGVQFPYIGPYLTWNSTTKPDSGVVVSFVSGPSCVGQVEYGVSTSLGQVVQGTASKRYHQIVLASLQGNTTYFYKVRCKGGRSSAVYSFKTALSSPSVVRFAALSDMQDNGETGRWSTTSAELLANHKDLDFLIISGDLPWNDRPGLWWTFFDKGRALFATKVIMPVPGNHDTPTVNSNTNTTSFETFFSLPTASGSSTYYSFRFGPALFLGMNSEYASDFAKPNGKQYQWMSATLSSLPTPKPTWVFAYAHHPSYNVGNRHWGGQGSYRDITEFFDGKVDWVFYGHEHMYQRMKPIRYNGALVQSYGNGVTQGVGYVVLPPAGAWPNPNVIDEASTKAYYRNRLAYPVPATGRSDVSSQNGFVRVELQGRTFSLKAYGMGTPQSPQSARVVDQVSYTKP